MNVQEFDTALSDLETRVDRLRALYENWFRGYEKMEPQVARKDVERRVYGLRKELPRNTALRFRYHQLYQRYTTLATYWQRTARQIEEGTYRLQLQRMKRRRFGDELRHSNLPPPRGENEETIPPPSYELRLDESLDVQSLLDDLDLDQIARSIDDRGPFSAPPPRGSVPAGPRDAGPPARELGKQTVGSPSLPPDRQAVSSAPLPSVTSARFARPSATREGPSAPAPGAPPVVAPARAAHPVAGPERPSLPTAPASPAAGAARPSLPNKPPPLKIPLPNAPGSIALPTPSMSIRPGTDSGPALPPLPIRGSIPNSPSLGGVSMRPPVPGPRPSVAVPPPAAHPPEGAFRPTARGPEGAVRPSPPRAVVVEPSGRVVASGSVGNGLTEQRLRGLYDEYSAARRKNNEGDVRYETLASTIQKMLPDLSKKHQGKQIDFEVVLKDGRVGLKPRAT